MPLVIALPSVLEHRSPTQSPPLQLHHLARNLLMWQPCQWRWMLLQRQTIERNEGIYFNILVS
jgi:hypothetical protein